LSKVAEILEILAGRVSAALDGVAILRTMIERRVLPLKHRATLLCDYSGVEDPTRESSEELDATKVVKWVRGFVLSRVIVTTECVVEVFSASRRPNLVSRLDSFSFRRSKVVG
jgi:hypothetical protein